MGKDFQAGHLATQAGQASREEATTGADFQDPIGPLQAERLQQPTLDLGGQHELAMPQGYLGIGEGQVAETGRDKLLPRDLRQHGQHGRVEYVPGTHLLVNHLGAGGFDVDAHLGPLRVRRLVGTDKIMAQSGALRIMVNGADPGMDHRLCFKPSARPDRASFQRINPRGAGPG